MITAGIDLGNEWAKVVVIRNGTLLSHAIEVHGMRRVSDVAERGLQRALKEAGTRVGDVQSIVAVGSRREGAAFAHGTATESICCARGAHRLCPETRTVIDLGAEKCLVVRCEQGRALNSTRNYKCAAGTGRYLKMVSKLLNLDVEATANLALESTEEVDIESTCAVFAESEIISLLHEKRNRADIMAGVFKGLAQRIYPLLAKVGFCSQVMMVGALARNQGIVKALEAQTGGKIHVPDHPEIVTSLGAAVVAAEREEIR